MTGELLEIRRFPVKSMLGEWPTTVTVDESGVVGDRAHALVDAATGKVGSAKDPRAWAALLALRAAYVDDPGAGRPIAIDLPDGTSVRSDAADVDARLSAVLGRPVQLVTSPSPGAAYDDEWPDIDGVAPDEFIEATGTSVSPGGRPVSTLPVGLMAPGTFQDVAPLTLLTTASLRHAARLQPASEWDPRRFRPNLLLDVDGDGFVENEWAGRRLAIGEAVIEVSLPTPRCVMTTLAQDGLSGDREILKTVARHNRVEVGGTGLFACLGAYATVVEPGRVSVGDTVRGPI